jgi:hypothetical protein
MDSSIGVVGQQRGPGTLGEAFERRATEGESPVTESETGLAVSRVARST